MVRLAKSSGRTLSRAVWAEPGRLGCGVACFLALLEERPATVLVEHMADGDGSMPV